MISVQADQSNPGICEYGLRAMKLREAGALKMKNRVTAISLLCLLWGASCSSGGGGQVNEPENVAEPENAMNRLANETSPYLLQHAKNPVNWYPWGEEALKRARDEDKPIFLSIGYSACHWCHVMEHESFENAAIAAVLNKHFIAIKVDREERPDLDSVYMRAVQSMTGSGGWPLSVFLTPDLEPFYGGTYFPPESRYGRPGFKDLLTRVSQAWNEQRDAIRKDAANIVAALARDSRVPASRGGDTQFREDDVLEAARSFIHSYDQAWGGFGREPKFPATGTISLLLRAHATSGDESLLRMATGTLQRMAAGGIYDHVGGGFHRYSVDRKWLVPHFEKMLYDNALLAVNYLDAYQVTRVALYERVATETLDYVLRDMTDAEGGFHSSEDADSEGEEGIFYTWSREQVVDVLGENAGADFAEYYGITAGGNFEGKNILYLPRSADEQAARRKSDESTLYRKMAASRKRLRIARDSRIRPGKDDKVLASWNGLMISAFARGYQVLGHERYRKAAERAGQFIEREMFVDGKLRHTYRLGRSSIDGYLDDYANIANACVDLYETTFDTKWIRLAERLVAIMGDQFWDDEGGGYFFTSPDRTDLIIRSKPLHDSSVPSGNAVAARALLRLWKLTGRTEYYDRARTTIGLVLPTLRRSPGAGTHMLCALDFMQGAGREIAIVGRPGSEDTRRMLRAVRLVYGPNDVVALLDPQGKDNERLRDRLALLRDKQMIDNRATAYICENFSCRKPMTDPAEVGRFLSSGASVLRAQK